MPEIALSAAWHAGLVANPLLTTTSERIHVVHRGTWTHGLGPDFADASLLFNDRELRSGSIEMHVTTRGWQDHGHHLNPAYNAVILHVVARHDGSETRREDGAIVPVVEVGLPDLAHLPLALLDWDLVGGDSCAANLAVRSPETLRTILHALGDIRLAARSAQIEPLLLDVPPAEIVWQVILVGLGYSRNQQPMRRLAELLPLGIVEELRQVVAPEHRYHATLGLLLGVGGFLPLSPAEAHLTRLSPSGVQAAERFWLTHGTPWTDSTLAPGGWDRARTRPANHPLSRLLCAAALVENASSSGGVFAAIADVLRAADPVAALRDLTRFGAASSIGADRAIEILASGILPALLAVASHSGDERLTESSVQVWEALPAAAPTSVTSRAMRQVCGGSALRRIGARGSQGLIHLDTALCLPRRCFECPVAAAALAVNE